MKPDKITHFLEMLLEVVKEEDRIHDGICGSLEILNYRLLQGLEESELEPDSEEYEDIVDNINDNIVIIGGILEEAYKKEEGYKGFVSVGNPMRFVYIGKEDGGCYHFSCQKERIQFLEKLINHYKN